MENIILFLLIFKENGVLSSTITTDKPQTLWGYKDITFLEIQTKREGERHSETEEKSVSNQSV